VEDWIGQAEQGVLVDHDCPAMFACASIVADADTLTRSQSIKRENDNG
jgi:hypothetical protein